MAPDEPDLFELLLNEAEIIYTKMLQAHVPVVCAEFYAATHLVQTRATDYMTFEDACDLLKFLTAIIYQMDACDRVN
jgi:hypothetical protein